MSAERRRMPGDAYSPLAHEATTKMSLGRGAGASTTPRTSCMA